jgi:SPP1 gp7 family putative phage head morphogenesis protein
VTTIDEIVEAARGKINQEIAAIEAETARVLRKKASASDWAKHPSHPFHESIVSFYAPLIAAALKDAITGTRATITSAQNKYAAGKAKTTKAAGDDVATGTFAQQVGRAAAEAGIGTSQAELKQLLTRMTTDSALAGVRTAIQQIPGATVPDDLAELYDAVDWSAWSPGNVAAADTLSGGLQAVLDRIPAILNGITDTNVERIGNSLADSLTQGLSVQETAANISDMVGSDARALTISNTQTAMAVSEASMTTYQTNGIDQYAWLAEDDACPVCQDNAENSPYDVGDDPDPSQPAHPNCRCAYIPVVKTSSDESDTGDSGDEDSDDSSDEGIDDG